MGRGSTRTRAAIVAAHRGARDRSRVDRAMRAVARFAGVLLLALPFIASCNMGGAGVEDTSEADQALYGNGSYYWPNAATGRVDINVCWVNPNDQWGGGPDAAVRAQWRDDRRRAVQESWSRHSRINFYGWDACTSSNAPGIHIYVCSPQIFTPYPYTHTYYMDQASPGNGRCPALDYESGSTPSQSGGSYGSSPSINGMTYGIRLWRDHGPDVLVHEMG